MKFTVDNQEIEARPGATIRQAAMAAEIYIPGICSHPSLPVVEQIIGEKIVYRAGVSTASDDPGAVWEGCGLCTVEIDGELVRSCQLEVVEGLAVVTDSEQVLGHRREKLYDILLTHPHACLTCAQAEGCPRTQCSTNVPEDERCCELLGSCELEHVSRYIGVPETLPKYKPRGLPHITDDPLYELNLELCIGCLRCVRACRDLRETGALSFVLQDSKPLVGFTSGSSRVESKCRFCGACVEVCPTGALLDKVRVRVADREKTLVPCKHACPAGVDIPRFLRHIASGNDAKAIAVIRERFPLVFAASYACFHPCEEQCRRGQVNAPVSVCRLKRFVADSDNGTWRSRLNKLPASGKQVAVIGSGPAGLTAAYYLATKGHSVTIHESLPEPGGMLRYGILECRYPRELLERDIDEVRSTGVEINCNSAVDSSRLEQLASDCDAVFIASGAHIAKRIELPGSGLPGVQLGVDFLRKRASGEIASKNFENKSVLVIGGGNVAIDVARAARRLGPKDVCLVSLEGADELPAWSWEVDEAKDEGIRFLTGWGPQEINEQNGCVAGVKFKRCTQVFDAKGRFSPEYCSDETTDVSADVVILAIGQEPSSAEFSACGLSPGGLINADAETLATGMPNVYAGGDVASGPASLIEAIEMGRRAAESIDKSLGGDGDISETLADEDAVDHRLGVVDNFAKLERLEPVMADPATRAGSFVAIEETFAPAHAQSEARRCLACDLRLHLEPAEHAPSVELLFALKPADVEKVPDTEGVYQLLDEERKVIAIKGVLNIREALGEVLEENGSACFFMYEEDPMFTKRESELMQQYLQVHGELPSGGDDELDDLF